MAIGKITITDFYSAVLIAEARVAFARGLLNLSCEDYAYHCGEYANVLWARENLRNAKRDLAIIRANSPYK